MAISPDILFVSVHQKKDTKRIPDKSTNCNKLIVSILDILTLLSKQSKAFLLIKTENRPRINKSRVSRFSRHMIMNGTDYLF